MKSGGNPKSLPVVIPYPSVAASRSPQWAKPNVYTPEDQPTQRAREGEGLSRCGPWNSEASTRACDEQEEDDKGGTGRLTFFPPASHPPIILAIRAS
jgi:hypothetical protein